MLINPIASYDIDAFNHRCADHGSPLSPAHSRRCDSRRVLLLLDIVFCFAWEQSTALAFGHGRRLGGVGRR